jgi:type I restriction enzyme M protein
MTNKELKVLEGNLWETANQMRANSGLKASDYATPVLGIIFLKFADNKYAAFEQEINEEYEQQKNKRAKREIHDIAIAKCGLYLPPEARYNYLLETPKEGRVQKNKKNKGKEDVIKIDDLVKNAMQQIENYQDDKFQSVLPKEEYKDLDNILPTLLETFNDIPKDAKGDVFGKIYEYFLGKFALSEGQKGGEFFTPTSVVKLIVEIIEPYYNENIHSGGAIRIYDPACGSSGMFVQSAKFIENFGYGKRDLLSVYGQERVEATVKLGKMNLMVNGLKGEIQNVNSYSDDPFKSLNKFDYVMANPPFNVKSVKEDTIKDDPRFTKFGYPHKKSGKREGASVPDANYLWISLFINSLNSKGRAGFVMANSASDAGGSEYDIRKKMIETGYVDVILSMPSNMFFTVTLPATLWFIDKAKADTENKDKILFIDARNIYRQIDRAHREFTDEQQHNLATIARLYRGENYRFTQLIETYLTETLDNITPANDNFSALTDSFIESLNNLNKYYNKVYEKLDKKKLKKIDAYKFAEKTDTLLQEIKDFKQKALNEISKNTETLLSLYEKRTVPDKENYKEANESQNTISPELEKLCKLYESKAKQTDDFYRKVEELINWSGKELKIAKDKSRNEFNINAILKTLDSRKKDFTDKSSQAEYFYKNIHWLQSRFPDAEYTDITGLCKLADKADIEEQDYSLNPGRYVGVAIEEDNTTPEEFKAEMLDIHNELETLNTEASGLENTILSNIKLLFKEV